MEILLEFIFELLFEGSAEIAKSRRVSKWIRYPAIALLLLLLIAVTGVLGAVGVVCLLRGEEPAQLLMGAALLALDAALIFYVVRSILKKKAEAE